MAWYKAHDTMATHPKTLRLARLLKVNQYEAVGILHYLWSWGLIAADKDGCLPGLEAEDIAVAIQWTKKSDVVEALHHVGYLDQKDGKWYIHDWYDYAGRLMDRRESERIRKAESRSGK